MQQIKAMLKRLRSYSKREWDLDDYPIQLRQHEPEPSAPARDNLQPVLWSAHIVNWALMAGTGDTPEEAISALRQNFDSYRKENGKVPRPGSCPPLEFASADLVQAHEDIARDFLARIVGLNYDQCFISDGSSLWDFGMDETDEELYRKIAELYGVDVSDVEGARLGAIFERIAAFRAGQRPT